MRDKMVFGNKSEQPGDGGAEGIRTPDPHNAIVVLYQLSYDPIRNGSQSKLPLTLVKTFRLCRL